MESWSKRREAITNDIFAGFRSLKNSTDFEYLCESQEKFVLTHIGGLNVHIVGK